MNEHHHRQDHSRPRPHRRRSGSPIDERRAHVDVRRARRAVRRARAQPLARRPRLDAHRQLGRARCAHVRLREGGRDPAPDLLASRAGGDRLPARRRGVGGLPDRGRAPRARRGGARARVRAPRPRASARLAPRAGAPVGRRPAAPDLHVRHDRQAERRAAHPRELLLDEPLVRPRDRGRPGTTSCSQVLPQFHCGGWNVQSMLAWWKGARIVLERGFDAARALELIERERVTSLMGVPANYLFMSQEPRFADADLSSLRLAVVGGAPMPVALLDVWADRGVEIVQGYGLTEAAPNVLCLPPEDARRKAGYAGKPYPYVELRSVGTRASCSCAGRTSFPATGATRRRPRCASATAGCSRATSPSATTKATTGSAGASRTWSSPAARTSTRPRSRRCCTSTLPSRTPRSSVSPTSGGARSCAAFVVADVAGLRGGAA